MGNCCMNSQVPSGAAPEEKILSASHGMLRFHQNTPDQVVTFITENSTSYVISPSQFMTITGALNLNTTDINKIDSRLFRFYKNFSAKGGSFDARKLMLLGVLLAKGGLKTKLGYYFDCVQGMENGVAGDYSVKAMFDSIVTIAVVFLPQLAVAETPGQPQSLTREQYEDYRDRLLSGKEAIVSRLMTAFLGTVRTVNKERFLQQADRHKEFARCLCSPILLRTEMLIEAANMQKGSAIKEAFQGLSTTLKAGEKK